MHPMLNIAIYAIRKAGNFIIKQYEYFDRNQINSKNCLKEFLYNINKKSNQIITTVIKKFYPSHTIININDDHTILTKTYDEIYWIIEIIDNNLNFIKQFPFFTLSIAIRHRSNTKIGVIFDPIHNELFYACQGQGAQFNNYRIRLNKKNILKNLNKIMLSITNFNIQNNETISNILHKFNKQHNIIIEYRCTGSLNLDLAYVLINRLDGCLIFNFKKSIKLISCFLIIKESGGFIIDFKGNNIDNCQFSENLIIGNLKTINTILSIIK